MGGSRAWALEPHGLAASFFFKMKRLESLQFYFSDSLVARTLDLNYFLENEYAYERW